MMDEIGVVLGWLLTSLPARGARSEDALTGIATGGGRTRVGLAGVVVVILKMEENG